MGITIEETGFDNIPQIATSLIQNFKDNGFTPIYYDAGELSDETVTATKAIFDVTTAVDPLADTQSWRIAIFSWPVTNGYHSLRFYVSSNNGVTEKELGADYWDENVVLSQGREQHMRFMMAEGSDFAVSNSHSYRLSISDHGFAFHLYHDTKLGEMKPWSLMNIQRPVNPNSGVAYITDEAPLFAISKEYNKEIFERTVVQSAETVYTNDRKEISTSSGGSIKTLNMSGGATAIQEDGSYVMSFPNGLNTINTVYFEEMDMISFSNGAEYLFRQDVDITVYGEETPRTYKSYASSGTAVNDVRMFIMTVGGGI